MVIPIKPEYDWNIVKTFAHTFVDFMVMTYPDEYVGTLSKEKRKNKIFIDYLRNSKGATAIAPYSTRAKPNAPVSVPLRWDELSADHDKNQYTIFSVVKRLNRIKSDPWKAFFSIKQTLPLD